MNALDVFCRTHNITTPELAAAAKVSRQVAGRIRAGQADTTITTAKMLAQGASRLLGRKVPVGELFELDFHVKL